MSKIAYSVGIVLEKCWIDRKKYFFIILELALAIAFTYILLTVIYSIEQEVNLLENSPFKNSVNFYATRYGREVVPYTLQDLEEIQSFMGERGHIEMFVDKTFSFLYEANIQTINVRFSYTMMLESEKSVYVPQLAQMVIANGRFGTDHLTEKRVLEKLKMLLESVSKFPIQMLSPYKYTYTVFSRGLFMTKIK